MSATEQNVRRLTISDIGRMYADGERIPMLTAYDYPTARILDDAGIPMILVGDSLGQVALGYESTVRVTMDEMLHHTRAVVRGTRRAYVRGGSWRGPQVCGRHRTCPRGQRAPNPGVRWVRRKQTGGARPAMSCLHPVGCAR